jgi:HNH endonuclease
MNEFERNVVVAELSSFAGQTYPASFIREKRTNGVIQEKYQYHNLVRGIYKPAGCELALSILQTLTGPYADSLNQDQHGGWNLDYSQQSMGGTWWDNTSLQRCIGGPPVAVIAQVSTKKSQGGSKYKIIGLGRVDSFDDHTGIFTLSQWTGNVETLPPVATERDIEIAQREISARLSKEFEPFASPRNLTTIQRTSREAGFRRLIIGLYDGKCSICGSRWQVQHKYEVEAAHIIPVKSHGIDDPRNGLALCRFHHWAFDQGLIALADDYSILVSSHMQEFSDRYEVLTAFSGKTISLPAAKAANPAASALTWHREKVFRGKAM